MKQLHGTAQGRRFTHRIKMPTYEITPKWVLGMWIPTGEPNHAHGTNIRLVLVMPLCGNRTRLKRLPKTDFTAFIIVELFKWGYLHDGLKQTFFGVKYLFDNLFALHIAYLTGTQIKRLRQLQAFR